jgi:nicotinate-nucleotide adenylyltransferase
VTLPVLALRPRRADVARLPRHAPGMKIGLFGGSFNPPHAGHLLVSRTALRRLGLDNVWWLVTPGNPLKENSHLPSLTQRIAAARALIDDPRILVSDIEARIGTRFTYDTIAYLVRRCPGVRFVWLMGADNLAGFHRWQHWLAITSLVPLAVVDRPGSTLRATSSLAAQRLRTYRIRPEAARLLPSLRPPAWTFLHGPRSALSSTALRTGGLGLEPTETGNAQGD